MMEILPGLNIRYQDLGWFATVLLILLNLFKTQISALLANSLPSGFIKVWDHYSTRRADREEHDQAMEEVQLNSKLQAEATKQLREAHHEDVLADMVASKDEWIQTRLTEEIGKLCSSNAHLSERVATNTAAVNRNSEILTAMNGNLAKLLEEVQAMPKPPGWLRR